MAVPVIYDANGFVRYIGNTEVAIPPGGFADIPLTEMYDVDRQINAPVVLDRTDAMSEDGTGFYVGLQILGTLYHQTMSDQSTNLVSATQGVFPGFNVWGRGAEWGDMSQLGLPGNMAFRPIMRPFCPAMIGDLDGDQDIDNDDLDVLNAAIAQGGDIFADTRRGMDLNNDWVLDQADIAILMTNFTGPDIIVAAPSLDVAPQITRSFRAGQQPPADVFQIHNTGGGSIGYQIVEDASWLSIAPSTGTLTGSSQDLALTFGTQSLAPGDYDAKVRVLGTTANSPQFTNIHVAIRLPGDFDIDGDVDGEDTDLFIACATGPAVSYTVGSLPPGCTIEPDARGFLSADFDQNHEIDMNDFAEFQRCYGARFNGMRAASPQVVIVPATWKAFPENARSIPELKTLLARKTLALPVIVWVVAVIAIVAGVLGYFLWDLFSSATFMNAGKVPDSVEGAQIRAAIDRLGYLAGRPGAHSDIGQAHDVLSQESWYKADTCGCGHLFINRKPVGDRDADGELIDETGEEGTVASVVAVGGIPTITLRRDFVIHANWTTYDTDRLALCLLAEWEHAKYGPDEETCQAVLVPTVLSVQSTTGVFPSTLGFGHGANEGVGR